MDPAINRTVERYLKRHPDVQRMLEAFQMSQEEYERALSAMSWTVPSPRTESSSTVQGCFDANAATATR